MSHELSSDLELFAELTEAELAKVSSLATVSEAAPGDVIVRQGEPASAIHVLLEGRVRVTALMGDADDDVTQDEEVLVQLAPGEFFGELSFITDEQPNLSVVAEAPSRLASLPYDGLRELIDSDAAICRKLLFAVTRTMVARLRATGRELVMARYFMRGH